MSQPLLFFWRSNLRFSALTDLPEFHSLFSRSPSWNTPRFSTPIVDKRFKQSFDSHNPRGFDRFAQQMVSECAACANGRTLWLRCVEHANRTLSESSLNLESTVLC